MLYCSPKSKGHLTSKVFAYNVFIDGQYLPYSESIGLTFVGCTSSKLQIAVILLENSDCSSHSNIQYLSLQIIRILYYSILE